MKRIAVTVVGTFLLLQHLPSALADAGWKDALEDIGNAVQERSQQAAQQIGEAARRGAEDFQRNYGDDINRARDRAIEQARDFANQQGRAIAEGVQGASEQVQERAVEQYDAFRERYGAQASQALQQTCERYGDYAAERLRDAYETHGARVAEEVKRSMDNLGNQVGMRILDAYDRHSEAIAAEIADTYEHYGPQAGARFQRVMDQCAWRINRYASDPAAAEKTITAVATVVAMYEGLDSTQKRMTKDAITLAADNIMVQDEQGRVMSLNDYSKMWIRANAPYLVGTGIAEDPAEALTYGVIYQDVDYITEDLKLVKTPDGEYCSIAEAVTMGSPFGVDATLQMLETAEAFESFEDTNASTTDLAMAISALETLSELNQGM